jgi:hypothetical protein
VKNKTGKIIGFFTGMAGFLFAFKVIILDRTNPEDELAPGAVLIASIICGILFAFAGGLVQSHFMTKRKI